MVLLDAALASPPTTDVMAQRLATAARDAGWPVPQLDAVSVVGSSRDALALLAKHSPEPARVAVHPGGVVIGARHDALDGLGILVLLGRLLAEPVRSTARGLAPGSRQAGGVRPLLERAWEVGAQPQARVAPSRMCRGPGRADGDAFAASTIAGTPRTADLVRAGTEAVTRWNLSRGARSRRISVAIGVSTVGGAGEDLADHSAFLRIRHAERLDAEDLRASLAHARLQPGAGATRMRHPWAAAVTRTALRLAAPRLGSTLLVSHLGTVSAPGGVRNLAFYPVTGGGSGLSLGAVTLLGRTTLTLRARSGRHDDEGLEQLLALVVEALG
jgi:hypothetical protein